MIVAGHAHYDQQAISSRIVDADGVPLVMSRFARRDASFGTVMYTTWSGLVDILRSRRTGEKDGPAIATARFKAEPNGGVRRLKANLQARTAIVLDIETNTQTGEIPPQPAEAVAKVEAQGWAGVVYTSHNHTVEEPRFRIIMPLSAEIAPELPAVELVAGRLGLTGVLDSSKIGASSLFFLPSSDPARLACHETVVITGNVIDAAWLEEAAGAVLAARAAEQAGQRAEALAVAERRRAAQIAKGLEPAESLIEQIRGRLDLEVELLGHGYTQEGGVFLFPGSQTGIPGVHILRGQDGVERVFSHHAADPLAAGNLPAWCGVKAVDVVDVLAILDFGADRRRALHTLARRFGIKTNEHASAPPEPPPGEMEDYDIGGRADHQSDARDDAGSCELILSDKAPLTSAREFIARYHDILGLRTLHHQNGTFYVWRQSHYVEMLPEEMRAALYGFLDRAWQIDARGSRKPLNPNKAKVANVQEATAAITQLPQSKRPPTWLGDSVELPASEVIACANGLLHLPTQTIRPHTPTFFTLNALDFDYRPDAPRPQEWLKFLTSIWPDDPEAIATLQEMFGLFLTGNTAFQKCFLIVGPKRSGKGTIARVLTQLLGAANVCGPTLSGLGTNFGLAPLIGKRVAIVSDARLSGKADQQVIVERLLSITGEDGLTIDRKFRDAWTGKLDARFLILTNEMPRLTDSSGALAGRFIITKMTRSFFGNEDLGLGAKMSPEMPGILLWAIAGWQRLMDRGYFVPPASSRAAQQELEDLGSPIGAFLRERCTVGQGRGVAVDDLYRAWDAWCREQGRDHTGSKQTFGRDLMAAIPGLEVVHPRAENGSRYRYYEGVSLEPGAYGQ